MGQYVLLGDDVMRQLQGCEQSVWQMAYTLVWRTLHLLGSYFDKAEGKGTPRQPDKHPGREAGCSQRYAYATQRCVSTTTDFWYDGAGSGFGSGMGFGPTEKQSGEASQSQKASGGGGVGGGGASRGRPVAAIIVGPDGVSVQPVLDVTKVALSGIAFAGTMVAMLRKLLK